MRNFGPQLFLFLLVVIAAITLACGSSSHIPQSVSVTPATADAKDFPNGVQFTTTVFYNRTPSPVSNVPANWSSCGGIMMNPVNGVSISSTGLAKCVQPGSYFIYAFVANPAFRGECAVGAVPCGGSCGGVVGTAQLTCP